MKQWQSLSIYIKHRLGFTFFVASITFYYIIYFESGTREIFSENPYLFFWAGSASLLPAPLIFGLSWRDSLKFLAYFFPLFFLFGLIALIIPLELVARFASILAIIWVIVLVRLIKRRPARFDLKVGIAPYVFLGSIVILGLSFLCAHLTLFSFRLINSIATSLSTYANYLLVTLIFYTIFSIVAIILCLVKGRKDSGKREISVGSSSG